MKRILVTGGAGFIGSHTVDLLLRKGYEVRILDNLEQPTHQGGKPDYLNKHAEFIHGDVRSPGDLDRAIRGVDGVIHLAATGGFTPELAKYMEVNSVGTARLLEAIRGRRRMVEKIVVASSVGVYGEGKYRCASHGVQYPSIRSVDRLEAGKWEPVCDECGADLEAIATDETKPPFPEKPYSVSKYDEERLVIGFGRDNDVPVAALRYFLTYGPRQSLTNPYTGVISIFSTRILNDLPPILFEDGRQMRDFVFVEDVARANVFALENAGANGGVFNVGTGTPSAIGTVVDSLAKLYDVDVRPEMPGSFRPGEARHIFADVTRLRALGWAPEVTLDEGLKKYLNWIASRGSVRDYFGSALGELQGSRVIRQIRSKQETEVVRTAGENSLTIVIPAYNEAGNLETIIRYIVRETEQILDDFEVLIVNDGSHDGTGHIADDLAAEDDRIRVVHHPFNIGYGGAQKSGFRNARKAWVIVVPADHQFDARDIRRYLEVKDQYDIVASRRIDRKDPMIRKIVSWIYNRSMKSLYGTTLRDINWVKMFRRKVFEEMTIESRGFAVDAEMVVKAATLGYRVGEVEVIHYPRTWGTPTGVKFGTVYRTAKELLRIRGMLKRMAKAREESAIPGLLRRSEESREPAMTEHGK